MSAGGFLSDYPHIAHLKYEWFFHHAEKQLLLSLCSNSNFTR